MAKFVSYISNGEFSVGTTGRRVCLFDGQGNELCFFKDIAYGYYPMFSPDGKIFTVKSSAGELAMYSLSDLALIKKFRFSSVDGAQDDGFCFSPDSRRFINIERHGDSLHSAISFYNTEDFSLENRIFCEDNIMLEEIEYNPGDNEFYVLGFYRNEAGVFSFPFIGKLKNYEITDRVAIEKNEYELLETVFAAKRRGTAPSEYKERLAGGEFAAFDDAAGYSLAKIYAQK
ncbi:MAG: hypothetical protein KBS52_01995 [Clostridiales bacterium]|nr:hypothetical protein [Candidatus Equinaster intestinalis]